MTPATVSVLGHDPAQPTRAWRSRIGIVLQGDGDLRHLTVNEIVRHFATFYAARATSTRSSPSCGLEEKRTTRILNLSGGQRRRLDVALGILGRPELLFLGSVSVNALTPTTTSSPLSRRARRSACAATSSDFR